MTIPEADHVLVLKGIYAFGVYIHGFIIGDLAFGAHRLLRFASLVGIVKPKVKK